MAFLFVFASIAFAQKDSIEVLKDTINIRGYVIDQSDKPFAGVKVSTDHIQVETDINGFFELKGAINKSHIFFHSDTVSAIIFGNQSRFIIYRLVSPTTNLTTQNSNIKVEAKKTKEKKSILVKEKKMELYGFVNYQNPATYPGGMAKFYKYIQDHLKYPKKAIDNNTEGIVGIEFDVTKTGHLANFKIIKDIDYDCAAVVIDILKKSKKWNPSLSDGKPVIKKFYIEIPFKLTE